MSEINSIKRIDELGRIVIPKDIRKSLKIKEGSNLELSIEGESIILRKHSPIAKIKEIAQVFTDTLNRALKHNIIITDLNNIIAVTGNLKKEYLNQEISTNLEKSILRRENMLEIHKKPINFINDNQITGTYIISTIISSGDPIGLLIVFDDQKPVDNIDFKIIEVVSNFIGKYVEE